MFVYIILIMMAWLITMPLWLSIFITTTCSVMIILNILNEITIHCLKKKLNNKIDDLKQSIRNDFFNGDKE